MRGERKREETETERMNVCRRLWRPETASDPLELGYRVLDSGRAGSIPNHWAISPAPVIILNNYYPYIYSLHQASHSIVNCYSMNRRWTRVFEHLVPRW